MGTGTVVGDSTFGIEHISTFWIFLSAGSEITGGIYT